ncbi:MAG TPA: LysR family transcriptional regulator [Thermomicrobiales bacterium]|nr:LysR family transcriptional regulator [Thermomicrobiales bacterium]
MIEIEAFVAVADAGAFTRAAARLYLSQPAVSRRIELLEREVGAPLFERTPRGARLTDAGHAFLPHARQVLAAVRDGADAVHAVANEDRGVVSLALVGTLASTPLTARLRAFRDSYPNIRLSLRTARSSEVSTLVSGGDVHLGLRYGDDASSNLTTRHVHDEQLLVVCAAASTLVNTRADDPGALAGVPWVAFPLGEGTINEPFVRALERLLLRHGLDDADVTVADSLTAQKRLIEADFGIGLLPLSSIEEELRLGTLQTLPIRDFEAALPVYLLQRRQAFLSKATLRLLETLATP